MIQLPTAYKPLPIPEVTTDRIQLTHDHQGYKAGTHGGVVNDAEFKDCEKYYQVEHLGHRLVGVFCGSRMYPLLYVPVEKMEFL